MENRIKLRVLGITYSQIQNGAYALVLAEMDGPRRIPIIIGTSEAQAIAIRLENLVPPRPMTHDLFTSFAHGFGIELKEVFIYRFEEGVFSSEMTFDDGTRQIKIDSRTSDAIAIALRSQAPIFTTEEIIDASGIIFDEEPEDDTTQKAEAESAEPPLSDLTIEELEKRLNKAVGNEKYELAASIQKELKKRQTED